MPLKRNWERGCDFVSFSNPQIQEMVQPLFGHKKLLAQETVTTGCANTNIKLTFVDEKGPLLLRVFTRDPTAAYREQALYKLVHEIVSLPEVLYVGQFEGQSYALVEYVEGILLRDLILKEGGKYERALQDAGMILKAISSFQFDAAGFFKPDLSINPFSEKETYDQYGKICLENPLVKERLGPPLMDQLHQFLADHQDFFPKGTKASLVHGDYDSANILVEEKKGVWRVKAILDWEFAFSGSPLFDVGNMLRFAEILPPAYETSFVRGLKDAGFTLFPHWKQSAKLLDLLSLLTILASNSPQERPHQMADVKALIEGIVDGCGNSQK